MTTQSIIKRGDKGPKVSALQSALTNEGYGPFTPLGTFGPQTEQAVIAFQKKKGLVVDGIAGKNTQDALLMNRGQSPDSRVLKEEDLINAAKGLGIDVAMLKAISEVETKGQAFFTDGSPAMLFERHIMRRELLARDLDLLVEIAKEARPDLVNSSGGGYRGGLHEVARLNKAKQLNPDAAYSSASYGRYQIMGFHWERLGYTSPKDFYDSMCINERGHLKALVKFIETDSRLLQAFRNKNFQLIAEIYNGRNYKQNNYDVKLEDAFKKFCTKCS